MLNRHKLKTLKIGLFLSSKKTWLNLVIVINLAHYRAKFESLIRFLQYRCSYRKAAVVTDGDLCVF